MTIAVHTEGPAWGGEVVAHVDGKVVFIHGALPHETVEIEIYEEKHSYSRGVVREVIRPNAQRRVNPCKAARAGAGCCDYGDAELDLQRAMKARVVRDQMQRIAHLDTLPWDGELRDLGGKHHDSCTQPTYDSDPSLSWRVRQRLHIDYATPRGDDDSAGAPEVHLGLHSFRSNAVVPLDNYPCGQVVPWQESVTTIQHLLDPARHEHVVWGRDDKGKETIVAVGLEKNSKRYRTHSRHRSDKRARANAHRLRASRVTSLDVLYGSGSAYQEVLGRSWELPVTAFWQAHAAAASTYAELVCEYAELSSGENAWDLYGGCGVFAHSLLADQPNAETISVVDTAQDSIEAGRRSFGRTGELIEADALHRNVATTTQSPGVFFERSRVDHFLRKWTTQGALQPPHVVVMDPPRAGAGKDVIRMTAQAQPRIVLHFGCDVASFARDTRLWRDNGYTFAELQVIDAFPNTHHMECFGVFVPKS